MIKGIKVLVLFITAFGASIIGESCNDCDCPKVGAYYRIFQTGFKVYERSSGGLVGLPDSAVRYLNEIKIHVDFLYQFYSQSSHRSSFSIFQTANACSCNDPGHSGSSDILDSMKVFSINEFDAQHPAGSEITPFMRIESKTIPDYVAHWNQHKYQDNDWNIIIDKLPSWDKWQKWKLFLYINGKVQIAETQVFRILP